MSPKKSPTLSSKRQEFRADALRNRTRILQVASEIFAADGIGASTEEIAGRAGVGIGTLFRHFPTKEALVEAVFTDHLHQSVEEAKSLLTSGQSDALFSLFNRIIDRAQSKQILIGSLSESSPDVEAAISQAGRELDQVIATLLVRAQRAGLVRKDVRPAEAFALVVGACRAVEHAAWNPDTRTRILSILFNGLRPESKQRAASTRSNSKK